jgi:Ariadne domain
MHELALKEDGHSWMDVRYLGESTDQLIRCREILKYTYVFGFYRFDMRGCPKKLLGRARPFATHAELINAQHQFEFHQEELEGNTERLSRLLEMPLDNILQQKDFRITVIDQTKLALKKFHAMFGVVDWISREGATGSFENGTCFPLPPHKKAETTPAPAPAPAPTHGLTLALASAPVPLPTPTRPAFDLYDSDDDYRYGEDNADLHAVDMEEQQMIEAAIRASLFDM